MRKTKESKLSVRIEHELLRKLLQVADEEDMSLAMVVRVAIRQYLKRRQEP